MLHHQWLDASQKWYLSVSEEAEEVTAGAVVLVIVSSEKKVHDCTVENITIKLTSDPYTTPSSTSSSFSLKH